MGLFRAVSFRHHTLGCVLLPSRPVQNQLSIGCKRVQVLEGEESLKISLHFDRDHRQPTTQPCKPRYGTRGTQPALGLSRGLSAFHVNFPRTRENDGTMREEPRAYQNHCVYAVRCVLPFHPPADYSITTGATEARKQKPLCSVQEAGCEEERRGSFDTLTLYDYPRRW